MFQLNQEKPKLVISIFTHGTFWQPKLIIDLFKCPDVEIIELNNPCFCRTFNAGTRDTKAWL